MWLSSLHRLRWPTVTPSFLTREIWFVDASVGCHNVDASVSDGNREAHTASLSIFAVGDQSTVQSLEPRSSLQPQGQGQLHGRSEIGPTSEAWQSNRNLVNDGGIGWRNGVCPQSRIERRQMDGGDLDGAARLKRLGFYGKKYSRRQIYKIPSALHQDAWLMHIHSGLIQFPTPLP